MLRAMKNRLQEPLAAAGYHFHGRIIRVSRTAKSIGTRATVS
jgi:hypothetical protein